MSKLIDRQEVLKVIREMPYIGLMEKEALLDAVKGMHSIEARKKGMWIKVFNVPSDTQHPDICFDRFMCSNCTAQTNRMTDFCPNCGTDMRGEEQDAEIC